MSKIRICAVWLPCILFVLPNLNGCAPAPGKDPAAGLTVAVSIPPQAFLVERIGGKHVHVTTLLQPGESPATYQLSDFQVSEVLQSSMYFRIGVPFERGKWAEAVSSSDREITIVDMQRDIPLRRLEEHHHHEHEAGENEGHAEGSDPHIWLAPELLKIQARTVTESLGKADPDHGAEYEANLKALLADLDRLHGELQEMLAPLRGRCMILYHPAWGYFCDAYGLEQVAIEIEGKEPSDQELTRIQARVREDGTGVIFVQPQISGASARTVAEALGVELRIIDPLAGDVLSNLRKVAETIVASYH